VYVFTRTRAHTVKTVYVKGSGPYTYTHTNIHKYTYRQGCLCQEVWSLYIYIDISIYVHTGKTVCVKGSGPKPYELKYNKVRTYANVSCVCVCLCVCVCVACVCAYTGCVLWHIFVVFFSSTYLFAGGVFVGEFAHMYQ